MLPPISFEVTSTSGVSADDVDDLLHAADLELDVDGRGAADLEQEVLAAEGLEALQRGGDLVAARASRPLAMNAPLSPEIVSRNMPVSWFFTVTVTPGMDAPCASDTVPRTSVVPC